MTEMCSQRVAPRDDRGGQPQFYRKRKRGYHRAYKRGVLDVEVFRFISNYQTREMMNRTCSYFMSQTIDDIRQPFGLLSLLGKEYQGGEIVNVAP